MSVIFGLPVSGQFLSNTWFIRRIPCILRQYLSSVFRCSGNIRRRVPVDCLQSVAKDSACTMRERGRGWRVHAGGEFFLCGCARKIILVRYLLRQSEALSWFPVLLLVLQGTGEIISTDHAGVWPWNRNCNMAIDPTTYLWKGLLTFFCYESTKICEYD